MRFGTASKAIKPPVKKDPKKPETTLPDEQENIDDEYIPEVDWDHTKMEEHYNRIWEPYKTPPTFRERVYDRALQIVIAVCLITTASVIVFAAFSHLKMRKQLRYVKKTHKQYRTIRPVLEQHPNIIPLDRNTLSVKPIYQMLLPLADEKGKVTLEKLRENHVWKSLLELQLPLDEVADWEKKGVVHIGDITFLLALLQYFLAEPSRKGTPKIRREVRDDLFKMIASFDETSKPRLRACGYFASACFSLGVSYYNTHLCLCDYVLSPLALLSPPDLGNEIIRGQTLDEFKMNYVRYMLRNESLQENDEIPVRNFNFLYKICDFSIGLTQETRGQLAK
ncbi:hypothetical protein RFI_32721 [Reticulomyxa filosa]|uniref:Uncharacterized protein n=1 Tax=Reticulomyxa filosa TaxID=46433 RepID=X6LTF8_RETFI|nr:hypothetical protein RFI_32721 [Reticulomyxa filosa]|eukprot:ETO04676.1 hypothetical protein RFI_32721 [Reticulomyxa filosa]